MRIAIVAPGFSTHPNDWAIPALLNLARILAQKHHIHIFSQRYPAKGIYQFDSLTHHALGGGQNFGPASLRIWLRSSRAIIAQHKKTPFDLLHAFWADEAGFSAVVAGAKIKRPVVVSLGGGELVAFPDIGYGAQRFLARRLTTRHALRKASLVTAGSNYQLDHCRTHRVPTCKLRLAPLGVDTRCFQPPQSSGSSTSQATIVQAASLVPVKNQILLLEIMRMVKKEVSNIKLNLAGAGLCRDELTKLADQLDLSQNITWHGQVPYPEMSRLYQQSHLYLQTSHHESQGMAVLEAMACGLPVLGTPVGVVKDTACRPANVLSKVLAAQVINVLNDKTSYQEFCQQARQIVEEKYSLPVTMNNFLEIYAELQNS